jgi:two-component system, chemotaxis family, CheB/CheR fusion protein
MGAKKEKDSVTSPTEEIITLLKSATDNDFSDYKPTTIFRRIQKRLVTNKIDSFESYAKLLRSRPDEIQALCREILINVTSFFRDPEIFQALENLIFPRIVAGRSPDDTIRVWVPGCSTGEEVYSLAISLLEYISQRKLTYPIQLFGTDISDTALEKARSGIYTATISSVVSAERLKEYFEPDKQGYHVKKSLRDLCVFARQNVVSDPPLPRMDLISCRNLLIYFGPALQEKVVPIFHHALKPANGFLVLGKSELVDIFSDYFLPVDKTHKFYVKKVTPSRAPVDYSVFKSSIKISAQTPSSHLSARDSETDVQREADRLILSSFSPPAVIVTENMDIIQFRGHTSPYLSPAGRASLNLFKMIRPDLLNPLRNALEQAKADGTRSVRCHGLRFKLGSRYRFVDIRIVPLKSPDLKQRYFLLVFKKSKPPRDSTRLPTIEIKSVDGVEVARLNEGDEIRRLADDLEQTRLHLQSVMDEREITVEELQTSNEEVTSSNEELQATNQELETAKEELESSNEELTALNEQLRQSMDQLRKTEERFRLLVSGVKDYAIFVLDPKGRIRSWNEGAERINGYSAKEIIGEHFSIFYREEDRQAGKPEKEIETAVSAGRFEEEAIRLRKDGTKYWANVILNPLFDENRRIYGFAKVTRDITERKLAEEKLRESEERFQTLVHSVKDYAIFMLDRRGYIKSWNVGAERIKGYKAEEILGQHFSKFYTEEDIKKQKPEHLLEVAESSERVEDEGWRVRKDGTKFWADVVITALKDTDGEILGFAKVTRDLTDRKRNEDNLKSANENLEIKVQERTEALRRNADELQRSNEELEQFAFVASHDLQEPLRMVSTYLQYVEKHAKDKLDSETKRFVDLAVEGALRLKSLVEDLLAFSRLGKGLELAEQVDVKAIVQEAERNLNKVIEESDAEIRVLDLPKLSVDSDRMVQVFQNLIGNAIKYRSEAPPKIEIQSQKQDGEWVFQVKDNGIGIDPQYKEKIFVVFQRLHSDRKKYPGTGIGLAICKKIIEQHRGRIWVESQPSEGSAFYFTIPRA